MVSVFCVMRPLASRTTLSEYRLLPAYCATYVANNPLASYVYVSVTLPSVVPVTRPFRGSRVICSAPAWLSSPSASYPNGSATPLMACEVTRKLLSKPQATLPATGPPQVTPVRRKPS